MKTKQEVFERYRPDYFKARQQKGKRSELTLIIDTTQNVTMMGRKSIIRAFKRLQICDPAHEEGRGRHVYYTPDTTAALKDVW